MTTDIPFDEASMAIVRRAYARQILAVAAIRQDRPLESAFASVPRERFLGEPPWRIVDPFRRNAAFTVSDPVIAYQDVLFALAPERGVNNGQPSLHAAWLHRAALRPGDRVAHIGAGTGYYAAVIAELVGPDGHVTAVEFDPSLAEIATRNLAERSNVHVVQGDGFTWPPEQVDCVYVSFSVERPADAWIDQLAPGGRLLFPLGVPRPDPSPGGGRHALHGAGLRVERTEPGLAARWMGPAYFVCAEGPSAGGAPDRAALTAAFEAGGIDRVRSLRWRAPAEAGHAWFVGSDWSLGFDDP